MIEAAEATRNPHVLSYTLLIYGLAHCDADPVRARDAMRRGLVIAQDSGNRYDESHLANVLDRLGVHEPAATIAGFAFGALTTSWIPEFSAAITHLRSVLGDQTYESLAREGETMTTAAMVTYALDQIDQVRTELNDVSK